MLRGTRATDTIMPATSSMTMRPGSLRPSKTSTWWEAHTPATMTPTRVAKKPSRENGMSQSPTAATALPAVPGATGK